MLLFDNKITIKGFIKNFSRTPPHIWNTVENFTSLSSLAYGPSLWTSVEPVYKILNKLDWMKTEWV